MEDPIVSEETVPSYETVKEKISRMDSTILISRIFFIPDNLTYRFQLIKKGKKCMMEIARSLLDNLKNDSLNSEEELDNILKSYIEHPERWSEVE